MGRHGDLLRRDAEGRLKSVDNGSTGAYTYDGDGRRVKKASGKLYWYGMGGEVLLETDLSGNQATEYVFFGGKRMARREASGNVNFYLADHLGSSRLVTDAAGNILDDSDFYPFGGEGCVVSSSGNIHGWGVTYVAIGGMIHTGQVYTVLRSPNGRWIADYDYQFDYARADVYLAFDSNDLGTYTTTSTHDAWCEYWWMGHFINAVQSSITFRFPYSAAVVSTTGQWPLSCDPTSAGWWRDVVMELRDQHGMPLRKPGIAVADVFQVGTPDELDVVGGEGGKASTDSLGR